MAPTSVAEAVPERQVTLPDGGGSVSPAPLLIRRDRPSWPGIPPVRYASAVTTCLAAICDYGRAIVTVADTRLSFGSLAAQGQKMHLIHRDWLLLYAAGDSGTCREVIERVYQKADAHSHTAKTVLWWLDLACHEYPCPPDTSRSFILAGFEDRQAQLWQVDESAEHDPRITAHRDTGYSAIGSGEWIALHLLSLYGQSSSKPVADTLYACCGAKFASEQASDVGSVTEAYLLRPGEIDWVRPAALIPHIRTAWEHEGQLPYPAGVITRIKQELA